MSTLHLINHSPARSDALASCLRIIRAGDAILLIEDGVLAALPGSDAAAEIVRCGERVACHALTGDLAARGLGGRLAPGITAVDHPGFVDLVIAHDRVMSWL